MAKTGRSLVLMLTMVGLGLRRSLVWSALILIESSWTSRTFRKQKYEKERVWWRWFHTLHCQAVRLECLPWSNSPWWSPWWEQVQTEMGKKESMMEMVAHQRTVKRLGWNVKPLDLHLIQLTCYGPPPQYYPAEYCPPQNYLVHFDAFLFTVVYYVITTLYSVHSVVQCTHCTADYTT